MDLKKIAQWNWFKREQEQEQQSQTLPVRQHHHFLVVPHGAQMNNWCDPRQTGSMTTSTRKGEVSD